MTSDDGNLFLVLRIATASVRTGFAMTWFLHKVRCKPGFKSSGRPTPARRLPIDLRRAACPHAAPRQTQRFPPSRQASTSAERVADGDAETMRMQGANFAVLSSRGWRVPDLAVSCPRKGFQNHWFWRRSFLPFFRRRKKGSRRRQDRSREVRIATASVRTGFAMTWFLHEVRRKPGFRSSGRPTPVRRLPIDYRGEICTSLVWADRAVRPCKFIMTPYAISPTAFCSAHRCYALPGPHSVPGPDRR